MLEALLFDLDGTLADTDPIHMTAWRQELADHDLEIDEAFYRANISGRLNPDIVADLLPGLEGSAATALIDRKEARFRALAERLEPLAGTQAVLEWARTRGLALALVTNAPRENAVFMLSALGLEAWFPTVVLGSEASAGKPDPAPYRIALERLGVVPASGLAFEDSTSGVRSAHRAGLEVVGMTTTHPPDELLEAGADLAVPDFRDERVWRHLDARIASGG